MIYEINPITDRRWESFVARHPDSSIFHTPGWLLALQRTYGYEPVVYTTSPPEGELTNGLAFCRVSSWMTGKRLVSLPFSDHCDPLLGNGDNVATLLGELGSQRKSRDLKYTQIRPRNGILDHQADMAPGYSFCFHVIDLRCDEKALYLKLNKKSVRKRIERAERESLTCREGRSGEILDIFYEMFVRSRRRQCIPPQPIRWFQNLSECLGPEMQVRVAMHGDQPTACMVTLRHKRTLVYKYSCFDPNLKKLGGIPWLFWKVIQESKHQGLEEIDLGRSSWDNQGLIDFKDHLGGKRFPLSYWQNPQPAANDTSLFETFKRPAEWVFGHAPLPLLTMAGRLLYRHIG